MPIDTATARVNLPSGVPTDQIQVEGYTGYQGSKDQYYTAHVSPQGIATFATTRPLQIRQGLTIVTVWPKGFVQQPSWWQRCKWFFDDNKQQLIGLLGLLLLLLFYIWAWIRVAARQRIDTIIPLFYPPKNMSPGLMRYFIKMGYDSKVLAADIVNMAVSDFLTIAYKANLFLGGTHTLAKKKQPEGEFENLYDIIEAKLFGSHDSIELSQKNNKQISSAIDAVSAEYNKATKPYFLYNVAYFFGGVAISVVFIFLIAMTGGAYGWPFVIVFILYAALIALFSRIFRGYTQQGLAIKKEVEGFKMFLATTEQERLKIIGTPPTKTPQIYEKYLPYAIALGVEQQWSKQFAPIFEQLKEAGNPYVFVWLLGGRFDQFNASRFASNMSSSISSSSIASSTTPPGSSSGFGGRGSSGGGGGGGGTGGW